MQVVFEECTQALRLKVNPELKIEFSVFYHRDSTEFVHLGVIELNLTVVYYMWGFLFGGCLGGRLRNVRLIAS